MSGRRRRAIGRASRIGAGEVAGEILAPAGWPVAIALAAAAAPMGVAAQGAAPTGPAPAIGPFVDVAAEAGLHAVIYCGGAGKDHILESVGSGAAFLDFDEDGWLDLYLVNAWSLEEEPSAVAIKGSNVLYRNLGGARFQDVTERAGVGDDGWGCGVCTGDVDQDGHLDIYVTNFGPNRLYRNRGDGTFEEIAERAGVAEPGWGAGASFFDADKDGDLDLYVANYIDCTIDDVLDARRTNRWQSKAKVMVGPFGLRGGSDRFYLNNGDGTFTDATAAAGMTDLAESYGLGVLTSDLDADGDVDVYVANDSNPNFLYRNEGDGTFTEIGAWCGAGLSIDGAAQAGMGVDAADFDGDGRQDIVVTNFARDYSTIYRNTGSLFFEDVTARHDIRQATHAPLSWGCAFFDADLDADVDLLVINGHIYPQVDEFPEFGESYRQAPILFENEGGRLISATLQVGLGTAVAVSGRGLALGDYDNDGDLDVLVTAIDAPPLLLRNDTATTGHWVKVRLINQHGSPAIGARVRIEAAGRTQMRELRSGSTYQSQHALDLHFGLAAATTIETLEVLWPDGQRTVRHDLEVDRLITIRRDAPAGD